MADSKFPLLDYTSRLFGDVDLRHTAVIGCQHLLRTNLTMFEYLFEKGLKPGNTFLLGKCYSTNTATLKAFREAGVHISKDSTSFDSHVPFDQQFHAYIADFLEGIKGTLDFSDYKKVIFLDDGGDFIHAANRVFGDFRNVVGVEQTTSGHARLKGATLRFPVINLARSHAKLKYESGLIADAALRELSRQLGKIKSKPAKILVIGHGAIGGGIYARPKEGFKVDRYDLVPEVSDFGPNELRGALGEYDLIIGCTGKAVIKPEDYGLLKKRAVLASVSSSDREFTAEGPRRLVPRTKKCHERVSAMGITLVNSGFPVNFTGSRYSVPPEKLLLTESLMFSAICLACRPTHKKGLIGLDKNIQEKIVQQFKMLSNTSRDQSTDAIRKRAKAAYAHAYGFDSGSYRRYNDRQNGLVELDYKIGGQRLFAVGTPHVTWIAERDARKAAIDSVMEKVKWYIAEVPPGKRLLMVEGFADAEPAKVVRNKSLKAAFRDGEPEGVALMDVQSHTEVKSPEPRESEVLSHLVDTGFSGESILLFHVARSVLSWHNYMHPQKLSRQLKGYTNELVHRLFPKYGEHAMRDNPAPVIDMINSKMRKLNGKRLLQMRGKKVVYVGEDEDVARLVDPTLDKRYPKSATEVNRIAAAVNAQRDTNILYEVDRAIRDGKSPFIIYGRSHIAMLKGSFDFLYGKPEEKL